MYIRDLIFWPSTSPILNLSKINLLEKKIELTSFVTYLWLLWLFMTILDLCFVRARKDWVGMRNAEFCKKKFCILFVYFFCFMSSLIICNQVLFHLYCFIYKNKSKKILKHICFLKWICMLLKRCIQNPIKYLRWSFLQKLLMTESR